MITTNPKVQANVAPPAAASGVLRPYDRIFSCLSCRSRVLAADSSTTTHEYTDSSVPDVHHPCASDCVQIIHRSKSIEVHSAAYGDGVLV